MSRYELRLIDRTEVHTPVDWRNGRTNKLGLGGDYAVCAAAIDQSLF